MERASAEGAEDPGHSAAETEDRSLSRRQVLGYLGGLGAISLAAITQHVAPGVASTTTRAPAPTSVVAAAATSTTSSLAPSSGAVATASPTTLAARGLTGVDASPIIPLSRPSATASLADVSSLTSTQAPVVAAAPSATSTPKPDFADVLGQSRTSYQGAFPGRATNIAVAARRIDGTVLAPGEVFSFLDRIGPQTTEAGFAMGYGVVVVNGEPRTVPMIGGGICDVSTILFQAVFRAGLGIVQYFHHSMWIAHYGAPPDGAIGLDATVDVQPVDFRFKNTTNDRMKILCRCENDWAVLQLQGKNQGWAVRVPPPTVTNLIKADPTVIRQPDPTLPSGKEVWIETARDGFDVTWQRVVTAGGRELDALRFTNHYLPSRNVMSIGAAGATATSTVTRTPSPTATQAATSTPTMTPTPRVTVAPTRTPTSVSVAAGQSRVPTLVGIPEARAQSLITQSGLSTTYVNYQGPSELPAAALRSVPVGAVLSQIPAPGTVVARGTTVYLAVRK